MFNAVVCCIIVLAFILVLAYVDFRVNKLSKETFRSVGFTSSGSHLFSNMIDRCLDDEITKTRDELRKTRDTIMRDIEAEADRIDRIKAFLDLEYIPETCTPAHYVKEGKPEEKETTPKAD